MRARARTIAVLVALLAGGAILALLSAVPMALGQDQPSTLDEAPLTDEQTRALVERVLENQVRDDEAIREYDRTERWITRGDGKDTTDHDVLNRIVPTGTGQVRVELERDGKPTDAAELSREWANAEQALVNSCRPTVQCSKEETDRVARRRKENEDVVLSIGKAFAFHYVGRSEQNGHSVVQLSFVPNPSFRSSTRFAIVFAHTRGSVWVDEQNAQLVRLDAVLSDDVTYAAGLVAKVYRGARFTIEQEEIAPGVWLPTHTTYDFDGKKFVFGTLGLHQRIEASDYRHVGSPDQALALVRREHPNVALTDP